MFYAASKWVKTADNLLNLTAEKGELATEAWRPHVVVFLIYAQHALIGQVRFQFTVNFKYISLWDFDIVMGLLFAI